MPSALETKMRLTLSCTEQANKPDPGSFICRITEKNSQTFSLWQKISGHLQTRTVADYVVCDDI